MKASFNDTLFNFRLIGLNWSVTVVFFFHSFMSHTVRTKYLKGGGHKLILSYYPGREISRVELVQLKKSWEILNCLIILLRGLFHSLSLSHFPSLSIFSFIPLIPLIPLSLLPFITLIPLISQHLTQYIITHSAYSPH